MNEILFEKQKPFLNFPAKTHDHEIVGMELLLLLSVIFNRNQTNKDRRTDPIGKCVISVPAECDCGKSRQTVSECPYELFHNI